MLVSHSYTDPAHDDGETPLTPEFSMVEYDLPDSDSGKQKKAQEKWIALMQITRVLRSIDNKLLIGDLRI